MSKSNSGKREQMTEVYLAFGEAEARFIKSVLEDNGIPCLLKSSAAPSVHVITVDGMGETKVMVWESMAEMARELIKGKSHA